MSSTIEARRVFDDVEPLVVRPRVARRMLGNCGTERLWELINSGKVESYLDGKARRITVASIKQHIARQLAAAKAPDQASNERRRPPKTEPRPTQRRGRLEVAP